MNKAYSRVDWENYPSTATPINETNLNKMDAAIDELDDRIVTLDSGKLNQSTAETMVQSVTIDVLTGIMSVRKLNGSLQEYSLSEVIAAVGLVSSETIAFGATEYDMYYLDYPANDPHGATVYTPQFEIVDGSTNAYQLLHTYGNDNVIAISINGIWYAVYDEDGNTLLDKNVDVNKLYIIKFDSTVQHGMTVIATEEAGTSHATTGYIKEKSIQEKHLSDELLALIKKNESLAGMTTFSDNLNNFGSVGISGGVDEWTNLTADPVPII